MKKQSIPRVDLYVDDETAIAEWWDGENWFNAGFRIVEGAEDDPEDKYAVFIGIDREVNFPVAAPDMEFEDIPKGVLWAVDQAAGRAIAHQDDEDGDDEGAYRHRRSVA